MTLPPIVLERLQFLARVATKESRHLSITTARLFSTPFTPQQAVALEESPDLAERVDAFVGRFGRLQDTLGGKLLPVFLDALGDETLEMIDHLDRAERLELIPSADQWMEMRRLRNQMIHEYVEDPLLLAVALEAAHRYVPALTDAAQKMKTEIERRGWT